MTPCLCSLFFRSCFTRSKSSSSSSASSMAAEAGLARERVRAAKHAAARPSRLPRVADARLDGGGTTTSVAVVGTVARTAASARVEGGHVAMSLARGGGSGGVITAYTVKDGMGWKMKCCLLSVEGENSNRFLIPT